MGAHKGSTKKKELKPFPKLLPPEVTRKNNN